MLGEHGAVLYASEVELCIEHALCTMVHADLFSVLKRHSVQGCRGCGR